MIMSRLKILSFKAGSLIIMKMNKEVVYKTQMRPLLWLTRPKHKTKFNSSSNKKDKEIE